MIRDTGKQLEALSTKEYRCLKNVKKAFFNDTPLKKDIPSGASPDLQELLTQVGGLLLPKPEVFVNIYNVAIYDAPAQTMQKARLASELYKKFGITNRRLNSIFSASRTKWHGFTKVFCGKPVYTERKHEDYCPVHRTRGNIFSEKCEGCAHNYRQSLYDNWVVC